MDKDILNLPEGNVYHIEGLGTIGKTCKGASLSKAKKKGKENNGCRVPRPQNAFMVFSSQWRKEFHKTHPGINNRQVSTYLGKLWRSFQDKDKEPYYIEANRQKSEHQAKYPGYHYSPNEARKRKATQPARLTKGGLPRKPYTTVASNCNDVSVSRVLRARGLRENQTDTLVPPPLPVSKPKKAVLKEPSPQSLDHFVKSPVVEHVTFDYTVENTTPLILTLDDFTGTDPLDGNPWIHPMNDGVSMEEPDQCLNMGGDLGMQTTFQELHDLHDSAMDDVFGNIMMASML